jgi:hypothetical protein
MVNYSDPEHAPAIADILAFCRCPQECRVTGRAKQDLIKLRLDKGTLLSHAVAHLEAKLPLECQMQTMYFEQPQPAYVVSSLVVRGIALYFKVAIPPVEEDVRPYLLIMSAHVTEFPKRGASK